MRSKLNNNQNRSETKTNAMQCNDDNVHEKTGIWVDEYMKRWKETQIQYDQLVVSFTSIWNTYANNKMSLFSIKEKGDLII